ncbi:MULTISPECIES: hypothetical protein [unclassified Nostoc]|uniref:hypothetical protein n=1 Tax=unclassified Nostoc TaxID=2593658 RepID=UPI0021AB6CDA|nr:MULTISPECIES: hypothetical protein [unclassified Nostoc]
MLSPLLELAGFYQAPYRFKTEVSVDIVAQGDNDEILRGRIDVLVLQGKLWIVLIESKKTTFDLELNGTKKSSKVCGIGVTAFNARERSN